MTGREFLTVESAYAKNKETATIPLNSRVLAALRQLRHRSQSEFVFVSCKGQAYKSIRTIFETARKRANLSDDVTPRVLRHTFGSRRGNSGASDRTLQVLGRGKEPKMIKRYVHLSRQHVPRSCGEDRLESMLQFCYTCIWQFR